MSNLGIGQLAKRAGVAIDTVRYYERSQLLAPADRLASGYRRYGEAELKRLRFIRRAKALGFSLGDIRESIAEMRYYRDAVFVPLPGPDSPTAQALGQSHVVDHGTSSATQDVPLL